MKRSVLAVVLVLSACSSEEKSAVRTAADVIGSLCDPHMNVHDCVDLLLGAVPTRDAGKGIDP